MRVLVVGSGGREHALAWRLASSPSLTELHAAPGNPGIGSLATCHPVAADDGEALLALARSLEIGLVVVGPETPLVTGVADVLRHAGIAVYGPSAGAARIEGSKRFAKDVMAAAGIPTARLLATPRAPCVLKADGLAAGKGVAVCRTEEELEAGLREIGALGDDLLAEELLEGPEVSLLAICDGVDALALAPARDYKRAFDGDTGPNTGGMGSFAPVPGVDDLEELLDAFVRPVLAELGRRGTPFVGTLFAGLIVTADGPRVLEYNCRFGDPETQSVLPLVAGDFLQALVAAAGGSLAGVRLDRESGYAVTVVLAAGAYPAEGDRGNVIEGADRAEAAGALVFHSGTARRDGRLVTNGGRLLGVTATGATLSDARSSAYEAAALIRIDRARKRSDIALDVA
ncbi:MAG: phosphoribosylamine--glycine ligase [Actinobacteria bacterium]|nr:phosphoribosylamine--glycine ligase [Actinomycetota bacterium]